MAPAEWPGDRKDRAQHPVRVDRAEKRTGDLHAAVRPSVKKAGRGRRPSNSQRRKSCIYVILWPTGFLFPPAHKKALDGLEASLAVMDMQDR
jgi:hypothetical protein